MASVFLHRKIRCFGLFRYLAIAIFLGATFLPLTACSLFDDTPDEDIAIQRLSAMVALGWESLQIESVQVQGMEKTGNGVNVDFVYNIVFTRDKSEMSAQEQLMVQNYLPMCASVSQVKGEKCRVEESMVFVQTENFGWMPELAVRYNRHKLDAIANWRPEQP